MPEATFLTCGENRHIALNQPAPNFILVAECSRTTPEDAPLPITRIVLPDAARRDHTAMVEQASKAAMVRAKVDSALLINMVFGSPCAATNFAGARSRAHACWHRGLNWAVPSVPRVCPAAA